MILERDLGCYIILILNTASGLESVRVPPRKVFGKQQIQVIKRYHYTFNIQLLQSTTQKLGISSQPYGVSAQPPLLDL